MRLFSPRFSRSQALLAALSCSALLACGDDGGDGGGEATTSSTASGSASTSSSSGGDGDGGDASSTGVGGTGASDTGGSGGSGGGGGSGGAGGTCDTGPWEVCGNDADEDCDGEPEVCPSLDWLRWFGATVETGAVIDMTILPSGDTVVTGVFNPDQYFIARYDDAGAELWRHTLTTTQDDVPIVVESHGDDVVVAGTADDELIFDDDPERAIGEAGRTLGFVARLDADGLFIEPPLLLNDTESGTTLRFADVVERADGSAQLVVSGSVDGAFGTIPGRNVYVATVDFDTLQLLDVEPVFADSGTPGTDYFPTAFAAHEGHAVVGVLWQGEVTRRDGGAALDSDGLFASYMQTFTVADDGELAIALGHALRADVSDNQLEDFAIHDDGSIDIAFWCDDMASAAFDGASIATGGVNRTSILRLSPESTLLSVTSTGSDVHRVPSMRLVDGGAGMIVSGRGSDDTNILGLPVVGHFIAELSLPADGSAPDVVWARSVMTSDMTHDPRVALDPADPSRSMRVSGAQQGQIPIDGTTYDSDRPVPFIARLSR